MLHQVPAGTVTPLAVYPPSSYVPAASNQSLQKPKVGLAVVCRCCSGNSIVQCLIQKRGVHSSSPNKWSFPGGRLEQPGDLDDDGAVGTMRELTDGCGDGVPSGLPPLIHIECCKSGRLKQTLYHVYVVDTSVEKDWENWQPKSKKAKSSEIDTSPMSLIIQGQRFPCVNGHCWVDMSVLIQECFNLNLPAELNTSDLQHGLIRWVQNYGEHILKTLIARSPKLPHHPRRTLPEYYGSMGLRPRAPRLEYSSKLYKTPRVGMLQLQPPFGPGQLLRSTYPVAGGSATNAFFGVGVASTGQLSPNSDTGGVAIGSTTGNNVPPVGRGNNVPGYPNVNQGFILPVPAILPNNQHFNSGALFIQQQLTPQVSHQSSGNGDTVGGSGELQVTTSQESGQPSPSSPSLLVPPGAITTTAIGNEATEVIPSVGSIAHVHQSKGILNALGQGTAATTGMSPTGGTPQTQQQQQQLPGASLLPAGIHFDQQAMAAAVAAGLVPPLHIPQVPSTTIYQEQLMLPSTGAQQFPLSSGGPLRGPPVSLTALPLSSNIRVSESTASEPLLPNPPLVPHPQVQPVSASGTITGAQSGHPASSRKEIMCKYYVTGSGQCPFGEKCWFAHPEPLSHIAAIHSPQRGDGRAAAAFSPAQTNTQSSPLHVQVSPSMYPNLLLQYAVPSPPQSPVPLLSLQGGAARHPALPTMMRPRAVYPSFSGQQPLFLVRPPTQPNFPLMPGMSFPTPTNPILKFNLLSEVRIFNERGGAHTDISQLATRADHFFVSFGQTVHDYKILFGGNRPYQDSSMHVDTKMLGERVTCLHSSRQQHSLLVVGTEAGTVYTWDVRKGAQGVLTLVHQAEIVQPTNHITALVHFSTSINAAQVVVAGTKMGSVSFYISQPPQKTFSLLFSSPTCHSPNPVVSLQILGGFLLSGDSSGRILLWSMQSQNPAIYSSFVAHSIALLDIHVINTNQFITIGIGTTPLSQQQQGETSGGPQASNQPAESGATLPSIDSTPGVQETSSIGNLTFDLSQLGIGRGNGECTSIIPPPDVGVGYLIHLWEFNKPPKFVQAYNINGMVISSSFHCHNPPGNMFLAMGLKDGTVRILNVPGFSVASELHFSEMKGKDCNHIALNLSREAPLITQSLFRNPFRDLILTTVWSDGRIMVCQVAKH